MISMFTICLLCSIILIGMFLKLIEQPEFDTDTIDYCAESREREGTDLIIAIYRSRTEAEILRCENRLTSFENKYCHTAEGKRDYDLIFEVWAEAHDTVVIKEEIGPYLICK